MAYVFLKKGWLVLFVVQNQGFDICLCSHNLRCDESATTGESRPVKKSTEGDCIILSGSKVTQGVAKVSHIFY